MKTSSMEPPCKMTRFDPGNSSDDSLVSSSGSNGRRVVSDGSNRDEDGEESSPEVIDKDWIKIEAEAQSQNEKSFQKEFASVESEDTTDEEMFDKLQNLLGKSKFYSEHLKTKLKEDSSKKLREEMLQNRKTSVLKNIGNSKKRKRAAGQDEIKKKRLFDGQEIPEEQPLLVKGGVMRDYQIKGYQWMCSLWENGINGILADEMGLGKTLQTIALFAHLVEMGVEGPFLVVVPLSTIANWVNEFKRFTPDIPVVLFHGDKKKRQELYKRVKDAVEVEGIRGIVRPVFVTSYEMILNCRGSFRKVGWKYIVVDEGHRLKNYQCRLIRELKLYDTANKLLLTGTPLQNNLAELWSLLNFLMPEIFNDLSMFQSWFTIEKLQTKERESKDMGKREAQILSSLHEILSPFLLRRIKTDIDLKIPPKKEVLVYCPMTEHQSNFYKATINRTIKDLLDKDKEGYENIVPGSSRKTKSQVNYCELDYESIDAGIKLRNLNNERVLGVSVMTSSNNALRSNSVINFSVKNSAMDLRKITNHPYLIEYPLTEDGVYYRSDRDMIDICGKLKVLDQLLNELIVKRRHKVLIFSQMTKMLDILGDYLGVVGYKYARLDGTMSFEDRQENIEKFGSTPDLNIFLLSTRAGGLGINLTAADTVIIYDSDWNPQQDLQAQDRCHRIGQNKPVMVYRLVTANTIDERIVERALSKRRLEKMVIHEKKFKMETEDKNLFNLTPNDLLKFLEHCDHAKIIDRKDGAVFTRKELSVLMDRSDDPTLSFSNGFKLVH